MEYRPLGKTGLTVSVAGLGCGGNSRLGLGRGASVDDCVAVVRTAVDLGVNFLDTAEAYGTEEIVGAAARSYDRTKLVISTKAIFNTGDTGESVTRKVEAALRRLGLDYVDVFHFHAVSPAAYDHHRDVLAPALVRLKEQGKVRHVGITETSPNDPEQKMLARAIEEAPWEVTMLAYSLMNQGARQRIFPVTQRRGIGTLLMFVVRNLFSKPAYRHDIFAKLVEQGDLDASILAEGDPLGFLVADGAAQSITDAAYRYARHEQGVDVVLFGTGNKAHVKDNVDSILRPALAPPIIERLHATFGHLTGVGLDRYPESLRRAGPFLDDTPGIDRSGYYANFNSSKLGISLNLKHPRGIELAQRMVAACDVVTESFTPGTMKRFGLDYPTVSASRPDLVMISMPLYGQTGPWGSWMGYGHVLQAASGFNHLTGWPDGPPIGTGIAYTDFLVPHIGAIALIAALDYRRRTGKGQYIDFSQFEAAVHGLGTAILDWTANGHEQVRMGNRDPEAAPHGCYRCKDGKWLVIACETEAHWTALKAALGRPEWCDLDRMRRRWQRLQEQKEIDRHLAFWIEDVTRRPDEDQEQTVEGAEGLRVRKYTSWELMRFLQSFGVPAGVVQSPEDMHNDPQLKHRGHYWTLQHPVMGARTYDGPSFRLSRTPGELTKAAPCLGEDNEYVYREILGLSEEEFIDLLADGAFE